MELGPLVSMEKKGFQNSRDQVVALNFLKQDEHRQQNWNDHNRSSPKETIWQ